MTSSSSSSSSYSYYSNPFLVDLNAVNGTADASSAPTSVAGSNDFPLTVSIGTGEVLSYLPSGTASKIWSMAGATYNRTINYATIPCNAASKDVKYTFQLGGDGGPVLETHLSDLVLSPSLVDPYYTYYLQATPNVCIFAIQNISSSSSSLLLLLRQPRQLDPPALVPRFRHPERGGGDRPSQGQPRCVEHRRLSVVWSRRAVCYSFFCGTGSASGSSCSSSCTSNCNPNSTNRPGSGSGSGSGSDSARQLQFRLHACVEASGHRRRCHVWCDRSSCSRLCRSRLAPGIRYIGGKLGD